MPLSPCVARVAQQIEGKLAVFEALRRRDLTALQKLLLVFLWDAERRDAGPPTVGEIAAALGTGEWSIQRGMTRLEALGLLRREPRWRPDGGCAANRYHVLPRRQP